MSGLIYTTLRSLEFSFWILVKKNLMSSWGIIFIIFRIQPLQLLQ